MSNFVIDLTNVIISNSMPLHPLPAAVIGFEVTQVLHRIKRSRAEEARTILLNELRNGETTLAQALDNDHAQGEYVAILYRYARAATEGTARLNLRLLARVLAGQVRDKAIVADEFLYYADMIASLSRNEIILLGTMLRYQNTLNEQGQQNPYQIPHEVTRLATTDLVPTTFATKDDYMATAGALQRTGLLTATHLAGEKGTGISLEIIFKPTSLLSKLNALADIEGVIDREIYEQTV